MLHIQAKSKIKILLLQPQFEVIPMSAASFAKITPSFLSREETH